MQTADQQPGITAKLSAWWQRCTDKFVDEDTWWDFPERACQIPLREEVNPWLDGIVESYGNIFDSINNQILFMLRQLEDFLTWLPWWVVIILLMIIAFNATRKVGMVLFTLGVMLVIAMFNLWDETMITLALMTIAILFSIIIGVPIGLLMATNKYAQAIINPILDAMQTMPPFVYLIPMVFFFGLGNVAAIIAIFIYAVPPIIRLTNLGIRLVSPDVVEAADAFGATGEQILWGVKVPLALPTLMAGVNQTIMMAIAMAVIASMIGARGLGQEVLRGLNNGNVGKGLEAGLAILFLAIILDRVTAAFGKRMDQTQ